MFVDEINGLNLDLDLLVIDDNSPDGTVNILDELANKLDFIKISHRKKNLG